MDPAPELDALPLPSTQTKNVTYDHIYQNPFFSAGFGLMGVGVLLTALRQGLILSSTLMRRRLLVSLEIPNKDKSYEWFLSWMAARSTLHGAKWSKAPHLSVETLISPESGARPFFNIVAGTGTHYFKFRGAWFQMRRERETKAMNMMTHTPWETVTLTTLSRDRHLLPKLLNEARDLSLQQKEGKMTVYTAWGTEWRPFGKPRRKRPLESVVLAEDVAERIERDVRSFLERRSWYTERGVPYRRGYLLHGPPGSGKSSFIQALAGATEYDVCLLNLSERGLSDDKLNHLLSNAPERCFVLIEDVDAAFNKRVQTSDDGYQSSVTFSGFLNALDGVASGEERIVFLTTNHIERLDAALIRPGRVDLTEFLGDATARQARELYERFYHGEGGTDNAREADDCGEQLERTVAKAIEVGMRTSMAALQGHFIRHERETAVKRCEEVFVEQKKN